MKEYQQPTMQLTLLSESDAVRTSTPEFTKEYSKDYFGDKWEGNQS